MENTQEIVEALVKSRADNAPEYLYWKDEFDGASEVRLYNAFVQEPIYTPEHEKALQLDAVSMDKDNRSIKVRATYPDRSTRETNVGFEFFGGVKWLDPEQLRYLIGYFREAYRRPQA